MLKSVCVCLNSVSHVIRALGWVYQLDTLATALNVMLGRIQQLWARQALQCAARALLVHHQASLEWAM